MKRGLLPFLAGLLLYGLASSTWAAIDAPHGQVFKLRDISALTLGNNNFLRGQAGSLQEAPQETLSAYPTFKSINPIYGSVRFGQTQENPDSGQLFHFALDESGGTGTGYDRLYFDMNQDLNLGNDPVHKKQQNPSKDALLPYSWIEEQILFDPLEIEFNAGAEDHCLVQLLPRLALSGPKDSDFKQMHFVRTGLYEGEIQVGDRTFRALLGNDYAITGPLNTPATALILTKTGGNSDSLYHWWGGERLKAMHKINGQFFAFSANATGTKLRVTPYSGALGTFEIGSGDRDLATLMMSGSLDARDKAVAVGEANEEGWTKPTPRCQLPVGDYVPSYLSMRFGRLAITISYNYHSEGKPRDRGGRPLTYGITIRKDQPFVLDFSNQPEVMFALPAQDQRIQLGDTLEVKGVLIDPKLDFMIRRLEDTTRKETKTADGQPLGYERNLSLDPIVIVRRANGEKVAEGVMPFG